MVDIDDTDTQLDIWCYVLKIRTFQIQTTLHLVMESRLYKSGIYLLKNTKLCHATKITTDFQMTFNYKISSIAYYTLLCLKHIIKIKV